MRKSIQILALFLSFVGYNSLLHAASLPDGPYLTLSQEGKYFCRITPVSFMVSRDQGMAVRFPISPAIDEKQFISWIELASREPVETVGYHVMATNPAIIGAAGVSPAIVPFEIFRDGSHIEQRTGQASDQLLKLLDLYCKQWM